MSSQKTNVTVHLKKLFDRRKRDSVDLLKLRLQNDEKCQIFDTLKGMIAVYAPPLILVNGSDFLLEAWSPKEILVKRKITNQLFAAVGLHEKFVSLYFMPLMTHPPLKEILGQKLRSKLTGITCFRLKEFDPLVMAEIKDALSLGISDYQRAGWI